MLAMSVPTLVRDCNKRSVFDDPLGKFATADEHAARPAFESSERKRIDSAIGEVPNQVLSDTKESRHIFDGVVVF